MKRLANPHSEVVDAGAGPTSVKVVHSIGARERNFEPIWRKKHHGKRCGKEYRQRLEAAYAHLRPDFFELHEPDHPEEASEEARDHIAMLCRFYDIGAQDLADFIFRMAAGRGDSA